MDRLFGGAIGLSCCAVEERRVGGDDLDSVSGRAEKGGESPVEEGCVCIRHPRRCSGLRAQDGIGSGSCRGDGEDQRLEVGGGRVRGFGGGEVGAPWEEDVVVLYCCFLGDGEVEDVFYRDKMLALQVHV